jgi:hypothetical protein
MKRVLFILHIAINSILIAQTSVNKGFTSDIENFSNEKIDIHINNDFLISGEKLFYKIYCLNDANQFTTYSKIAHIELINHQNKTILKQKVSLNDGRGYGDFFINTEVKTGSYKLLAYTNWMLNKNSYFTKDIIIINPFSNKLGVVNSEETPINSTSTTTGSKKPVFKNIKKTYGKREKITVDFSSEVFSNINGDLSLSVALKNNYPVPSLNDNVKLNSGNKLYIPELRGSLIKGKISSKNAKLINVKLALTFDSNSILPLTAITNKLGEFYFNIENLNTNSVSISILEKNKSDYTIELIETDKANMEFTNFAPIKIDEKTIKLIKNRSLYSQIENAYFSVKKDSIVKSIKKDHLLDKITVKYHLDAYTRFNTVKETFIEVIEGAGFYKKEDGYQINVTDSDASETLNYLPSLLIIDGRIIMDHTNFMNYNSRNIKSISLVKDKYFYGNAIYQGIVIVETFKGNYAENNNDFSKFKVKAVQPEKIYFFQKHKNDNSRIPDFRTQLYWNPSINKTTKELTIYSSDVSGTYEIVVKGYNKNGKLLLAKQEFTVE